MHSPFHISNRRRILAGSGRRRRGWPRCPQAASTPATRAAAVTSAVTPVVTAEAAAPAKSPPAIPSLIDPAMQHVGSCIDPALLSEAIRSVAATPWSLTSRPDAARQAPGWSTAANVQTGAPPPLHPVKSK